MVSWRTLVASEAKPTFEGDLESPPTSEETCCDFLNQHLYQVRPGTKLKFVATGSTQPRGHCSGTSCRPDLIAADESRFYDPPPNAKKKRGNHQPIDTNTPDTNLTDTFADANASKPRPPYVDWIYLETVVAYHPRGKGLQDNIKQALAYTGYLLAARPDRVAALGLYIGSGGFAITANETTHKGYEQVGSPSLGCWTTILKPIVSGPVFKFQYLKSDDILEGKILETIDKFGGIPGVVRMGHYGWVKRKNGNIVECPTGQRKRAYLELEDEGDLFMGVNNPREALIVIWDLLEATRILYKKHKILHRDISKGNVLVKKSNNKDLGTNVRQDTAAPRTLEFYSVKHLLDSDHPRDETPTLLIDFDHAADEEEDAKALRQTVGTPIFMTRAVVAHEHIIDPLPIYFLGLPRLSDEDHEVYKTILPDHLRQFPQPEGHQRQFLHLHKLPEMDFKQQHPWSHELQHHPWSRAVHIRPKDSPKDPKDPKCSKIHPVVWMHLTTVDFCTGEDLRDCFFSSEINRGRSWLDPAYEELNSLFREMANQISRDLYWINKESTGDDCPGQMEKPDFLHEALQRLIFNFLVEHKHKGFMELTTDITHRQPEAYFVKSPI